MQAIRDAVVCDYDPVSQEEYIHFEVMPMDPHCGELVLSDPNFCDWTAFQPKNCSTRGKDRHDYWRSYSKRMTGIIRHGHGRCPRDAGGWVIFAKLMERLYRKEHSARRAVKWIPKDSEDRH